MLLGVASSGTGAQISSGYYTRLSERRAINHAVNTRMLMTRMISDANALMSGVTLSFTFEKMYIGKVLLPGPDTKLAITRSSSDSVKASSQPAIIAGAINGKVMSKTMRRGRQPRSMAASSSDSSIVASRERTITAT